jgi:ATP/maltotriose-dependent transcriptional regulator MalT
MPNMDHSVILLIVLTLTELAVLGIFIFFIRKMKGRDGDQKTLKATEMLESIVNDSINSTEQLRVELEKKQELMRRLNEQLDSRLVSLEMFCNRTENLVRACPESLDSGPRRASLSGREKKIIILARNGRGTDEIAGHLALAKEEVELVLGLEKKLARLGAEKESS